MKIIVAVEHCYCVPTKPFSKPKNGTEENKTKTMNEITKKSIKETIYKLGDRRRVFKSSL